MPPIERPIICAGIYFDGDDILNFFCVTQNKEDHQAGDLVTIRLDAPDMDIDEDLFPTADSYWITPGRRFPFLCYYFDQEEVTGIAPAFTNDPDEEELPAEFLSYWGFDPHLTLDLLLTPASWWGFLVLFSHRREVTENQADSRTLRPLFAERSFYLIWPSNEVQMESTKVNLSMMLLSFSMALSGRS